MSNYLNKLVAKNLNLIDTVQPFALSVFRFLPESSIEISNEEIWGINQEIVMGDDGDSELSSTQTFPEQVEISTTTNKISSTPNTQWFSSSPVSGQFIQQESETIFSPLQTQPTTELNGQQPAKIHETVFPSQSPKVISSSPMSLSEVGTIEPASNQTPNQISHQISNQILPTQERQQLIPAQVVETNTNVANLEVEQLTQPVTEPNRQQPAKIHETVFPSQSPKVISSSPLPMSLSEVGTIEPASNQTPNQISHQISNQILPAQERQQLIPAQVMETNTSVAHLEVEQVTQKAIELNGQEPVKSNETVFPSQSPKVVSSKPLPMSLPEVGAIEPASNQTHNQISHQISNQILPAQERQQLIPAQVMETNTSVAHLEVEQVTQKAIELNGQQPVKSNETVFPSQSPKVVSSKPLPMPLSEVGAVEPTSNQTLPTQERQQLIPAQMVETNTSVAHLGVEQVTQKATELNGQQPVKSNETVFPSQSPKVLSSKPLPMPLSEVGAVEPTSNQILPTQERQQLIPAQAVETNTLLSEPTVKSHKSNIAFLSGQPAVKSHEAVSPARVHKASSPEQSPTQPQLETVTRKSTSDKVLTQSIVPVQPTTNFPDNSPHPTPNIIQPINNDGRRGAVFVSASRQEAQQRESSGNSTTSATVQVSIGRMEIRTPQPPPPPRPKPRPKLPVMSLDEYLRQRSRGR